MKYFEKLMHPFHQQGERNIYWCILFFIWIILTFFMVKEKCPVRDPYFWEFWVQNVLARKPLQLNKKTKKVLKVGVLWNTIIVIFNITSFFIWQKSHQSSFRWLLFKVTLTCCASQHVRVTLNTSVQSYPKTVKGCGGNFEQVKTALELTLLGELKWFWPNMGVF